MGLEPTLKVLQTHTLTIMLPASLTISNQKNKNTHNTQKNHLTNPNTPKDNAGSVNRTRDSRGMNPASYHYSIPTLSKSLQHNLTAYFVKTSDLNFTLLIQYSLNTQPLYRHTFCIKLYTHPPTTKPRDKKMNE